MLGVLAQIKMDKDSIESLVGPVETADRIFQEIQGLQAKVEGLEYKFDIRGQGGARTVEDIQSELNDLQSKR